jgi:hypothetical protein
MNAPKIVSTRTNSARRAQHAAATMFQAVATTNPALVAYVTYMVCLTLTVIA